jgi:hypothetical protein
METPKKPVEPPTKPAKLKNAVVLSTPSPTQIKLPAYTTPAKKDLAVIVPFFNPTQSLRIAQNVLLTTSFMRAAGLVTGDEPFLFPEAANNFLFRSTSYMFYKENLFACVEKRLPASYTKLLLLDSDILFEMPDWYNQLSAALDEKQVIQPFESAHWLGADFRPTASKQSVFVVRASNTHTGFAWAFRRDWYATAGICEYALIGGGDSLFYLRIGGGGTVSRLYHQEVAGLPHIPTPMTGYLKQKVYHLFHGPLTKRQYDTRQDTLWAFLQKKGLTKVSELVSRREDGILEWLPAYCTELNALMLHYFQERKDDDIS